MAVMMGSLYNALITAKVPVDQAQKAAEEVAAFEDRAGTIDSRFAAIDGKFAAIEGRLVGMQVVLGIVVALQLMTVAGIISFIWRGVHL